MFAEGEIRSWPLQLLNETPITQEYILAAGSTYNDIQEKCDNKPIVGTYGNTPITRLYITSSHEYMSSKTLKIETHVYSAFAILNNGSSVIIAQYRHIKITEITYVLAGLLPSLKPIHEDKHYYNDDLTLPQTIRFRYLSNGKTFKLLDLPTAPQSDMNTVWRDGTYLRIGH